MKRLFALAFSALMLATCASSSSRQEAGTTTSSNPYSLEAKTIPVGVIPAGVIHDAQRNKDLQVSIDYPTHGGPYPVVIFSHEYGPPENAYVGLSAFWASHGYVVIRPRHADFGAIQETLAEPFPLPEASPSRRGRRNEPSSAQPPRAFRPDPSQQWMSHQTPADWANRVADIKLVIDSIPQLIQQYPEIKERVDATKIGVSGHSYGAFTALLVGGVRTFSGGNAVSYADPRVKAIEAMSSPGPSTDRGLTAESFATLKLPTLFLTGSNDYGATQAEDPAWRRQAYELSPAGDKWFVNIMGIGPSAFTGRFGSPEYIPNTPAYPYPGPVGPGANPAPQPVPNQPRNAPSNFRQLGQANTVRTVSLAFWDAYLKNESSGRNYMTGLLSRSDLQVANK
jgi:dienelactone hydrolase